MSARHIVGAASVFIVGLFSAQTFSQSQTGWQTDSQLGSKYWQSADSPAQEAFIEELTPPGIQVVVTALEGPVYADEQGRTLYKWPLSALRNGSTGDRKDGPSNCGDEVIEVSAGLMSPYPPNLLLPVEQRVSCSSVWPPLLADADAEELDKWTLTERANGDRQWSYDGYPLYRSHLDEEVGDVFGGSKIRSRNDGGVVRVPVGPPSDVPAGFKVIPSTTGRLLVNKDEFSVYAWDGDESNKSNCDLECLKNWTPVPAPGIAMNRGEWTVVKQLSGFNQWAFRGQPLYTHNNDPGTRSFAGGDVPNWRNPQWHNVYTQRAVTPPGEFTVQDVEFGGQVLADSSGRSIYLYNCRDDSMSQIACDHPGSSQDYRLAICGDGDPELCRATFPYVLAGPDAVSASSLWSVIDIDEDSGNLATAEVDPDKVLKVWAYRKRPVYTYVGDDEPGVTNGDGIGEFTGSRNGYKVFVLRDDFGENAFRR
ncbi:hypothetical protein R0137_08515 [Congregibacter brevis]|uniref:Uncharacterized protein n=1 Tax=Congregibacter brevis TaxID=3081201 RepID=A0ABZ0IHQ0_9GAMM|nr:hypothetical protein R0137_08515 [Congregibacter sp. IMCC45268]